MVPQKQFDEPVSDCYLMVFLWKHKTFWQVVSGIIFQYIYIYIYSKKSEHDFWCFFVSSSKNPVIRPMKSSFINYITISKPGQKAYQAYRKASLAQILTNRFQMYGTPDYWSNCLQSSFETCPIMINVEIVYIYFFRKCQIKFNTARFRKT